MRNERAATKGRPGIRNIKNIEVGMGKVWGAVNRIRAEIYVIEGLPERQKENGENCKGSGS